ncbi:hypothetical protein [Pseudomonas sp. AA-38]|uniref:hypothetical protein n=1 Tax=Pseudomonas sp. AA-38 TaxID=3028807 RepID=UPI0023F7BF66|nr:hypothetical protein [Pseudomonas sp. AA-38]
MVRVLLLLFFLAILSGCDRYSGPLLQNGFPFDVEVTVMYEDGSEYSEVWPPCRRVFIDASEVGLLGMERKDTSVDEILVKHKGDVALHFDKEQMESLVAQAKKKNGILIWQFDAAGISFIKASDDKCPANPDKR